MSQVIADPDENVIFASGQIVEPDRLFVMIVPSEATRIRMWDLPHANHLTSDSRASMNVTLEPLTLDELTDVETSRREMAGGESKRFDSVDNALSWLDSE